MAILYLLNRPDVAVMAITVVGTGEAHCGPGVRNALKMVALAGHQPVPVACGSETPLQGRHSFPQAWRDIVDSLSGISLPDGSNPDGGSTAAHLLAQTVRASPGAIDIIALGPLTNLAEAFQAAPGLAADVDRIYVMGGAVNVPGNVSADVAGNTTAEWNIYVDPRAANIVFGSGASVVMVGLDATNQAPLSMDFYRRLEAAHTTPSSAFVFDVLSRIQDFIQAGSYYFWDPLTAGVMTDESLASFQQFPICVVEDEGPESGRTRISDGCPALRVAVAADGPGFERTFLDTLNAGAAPGSAQAFPLAGNWTGTARNGSLEMQISIHMLDSCSEAAVCGSFEISSLPCSGDFVFIGMSSADTFEFSAVNKKGTCGVARDFLKAQADGTLLYTSRSEIGDTSGTLNRITH